MSNYPQPQTEKQAGTVHTSHWFQFDFDYLKIDGTEVVGNSRNTFVTLALQSLEASHCL